MAWAVQLPAWALATGTVLFCFLLRYLTTPASAGTANADVWENVATVGVGRGGSRLSWGLAIIRSLWSMQSTDREGYYSFSKKNKPFALPTMWTGGALLVLPPSMLHLLNRPRDELSSFGALLENAQFQYLMTDRDVYANTIHFDIVRKDLAPKNMAGLAAVMAEEWDGAFGACWGRNTKEERVVNAWDSMVRIIARVALRIMVGLPGCRDEAYLERSRLYANAVLVDACFINSVPPAFRPVVAPLTALRTKYHQRKLMAILVPLVEERIQQHRRQPKDTKQHEPAGHHDVGDVIQWLIRVAENHGPDQLTSEKIATRILALTSMFVFAIGWVFVHAVLDIYCAPAEDGVVAALQAECASNLDSLYTKEGTDALYRLDSAVRESMRLNDVMVHLLPLDVLAGAGIDLGNGTRVTAGSGVRTVFPARMVHMDADLYPDPNRFDAFRFSREFEGSESSSTGNGTTTRTRKLMTSVTTDFLPFGYGRHACPGRWFVAHMVKQGVAYMLLNYDVQVTKRPGKKTALLNFMMPPEAAEMRVRRKAAAL